MGVHTGVPQLGEEGYTGLDVIRASRITAAGHGGQILLSSTSAPFVSEVDTRDLERTAFRACRTRSAFIRFWPTTSHWTSRRFAARCHSLGRPPRGRRQTIPCCCAKELRVCSRRAGSRWSVQARRRRRAAAKVAAHKPDVAIIDIRMPPTHTYEGLRAAPHDPREHHPGRRRAGPLAVRRGGATRLELLGEDRRGVGYLLKDRVSDLERFADAIRSVAEGGSALDPEVVSESSSDARRSPARRLTAREREVLGLMAEGRSNQAIAERLLITLRAVERHVTNIFTKLGLPASRTTIAAYSPSSRSYAADAAAREPTPGRPEAGVISRELPAARNSTRPATDARLSR